MLLLGCADLTQRWNLTYVNYILTSASCRAQTKRS